MPKVVLTQKQIVKSEAKELTKRAKMLARAEGITQQQLARLTGKDQSVISRELNGGCIKIDTLIAIATLTNREVFK